MRFHTVFITAAIAACSLAAVGAPARAANQAGAYQTLSAANAAACARSCEEDGLCIAWTFADSACSLSAVAPQQPASVITSGLSTRAPSFARAQAELRHVEQPAVLEAPVTPPLEAQQAPTRAQMTYEEASLALLGGPEDEALRPRLGARH